MTISADTITLRKLILARQLFEHALILSASTHSQVSKIMAVIGFDAANETAVKAVVGALESSKQPADTFQGLVQQANDLLVRAGLGPMPDQARIQHVHSIRNDAQHKAKYPNETEVSDCRTYSRDFLQSLLSQVWGMQFDTMSMVDLICHTEAKRFLSNAEAEFKMGHFEQAVGNAAAGLTFVLNRVQRSVVGATPNSFEAFVMADSFGRQRPNQDANEAFKKMQSMILYLAFGMNLPDYVQYEDIAGKVVFFIGGDWNRLGGKQPVERDHAEFVLAYASSAIVQIEERVRDLDKPFGLEWFAH